MPDCFKVKTSPHYARNMGKEKLTYICILVLLNYEYIYKYLQQEKSRGKFVKRLQKFTGNTLVGLSKNVNIKMCISTV